MNYARIAGDTFKFDGNLSPRQQGTLLHRQAMSGTVYNNWIGSARKEYNSDGSIKDVIRSGSETPIIMHQIELKQRAGSIVEVPMLGLPLGDEYSEPHNAGVVGAEQLVDMEYPVNWRFLDVRVGFQRVGHIEETVQQTKQRSEQGKKVPQILTSHNRSAGRIMLDVAAHWAFRAGVDPYLIRELGVVGGAHASEDAVVVRPMFEMDGHHWYVKADGTLSEDASDLSASGYIKKNTLQELSYRMAAIKAPRVRIKGGDYWVMTIPAEDTWKLQDDDDFNNWRSNGKALFKNAGMFDQFFEPLAFGSIIVLQIPENDHLDFHAWDWSALDRVEEARRGHDVWKVAPLQGRTDLGASLTSALVNEAVCTGANALGYADAANGFTPVLRKEDDYGRILGKGLWLFGGFQRADWKALDDVTDIINQSCVSLYYRNRRAA